MADGDFLPLRQLGHFHAECGAELGLGFVEDMLELAAGVRCHYYSKHQPDVLLMPSACNWLVPFAAMSVLLIGVLEYSLASARRTSFFTIWSWVLPPPSSSLAPVGPSMSSWTEEASEAEGDRRRRTGGGEGSASACYSNVRASAQRTGGTFTDRLLRARGIFYSSIDLINVDGGSGRGERSARD